MAETSNVVHHIASAFSLGDHHAILDVRRQEVYHYTSAWTWGLCRVRRQSLQQYRQRYPGWRVVAVASTPQHCREILERARSMVDQDKSYNPFWNNCEHFARRCFEEKDWSEQAENVINGLEDAAKDAVKTAAVNMASEMTHHGTATAGSATASASTGAAAGSAGTGIGAAATAGASVASAGSANAVAGAASTNAVAGSVSATAGASVTSAGSANAVAGAASTSAVGATGASVASAGSAKAVAGAASTSAVAGSVSATAGASVASAGSANAVAGAASAGAGAAAGGAGAAAGSTGAAAGVAGASSTSPATVAIVTVKVAMAQFCVALATKAVFHLWCQYGKQKVEARTPIRIRNQSTEVIQVTLRTIAFWDTLHNTVHRLRAQAGVGKIKAEIAAGTEEFLYPPCEDGEEWFEDFFLTVARICPNFVVS